AKKKIILWLEGKGAGTKSVNYKLRDWLFSRQRYWGEPFPIIHVDGEHKALPESELPVTLPEVDKYQPTGDGEPPLANAKEWIETTDPKTGKTAIRETNTMPQWAGSCWYYLRYISPEFDGGPVDPDYENYWMPVDLYVGGAEHAVLHLLYARFWHKVLHDIGVVSTKEPFQKLVNQGMILGEMEFTGPDGKKVDDSKVEKKGDDFVLKGTDTKLEARAHKMSKSRGNVINPDNIIAQYGADSLRLYEMFMGPLEQVKPWSTKGVEGVNRFLNRVWRLLVDEDSGEISDKVKDIEAEKKHLKPLHEAIKKVSEDIENLRFNTGISALMIFVNEANGWDEVPLSVAKEFVQILNPFAPHITEELWRMLGNEDTLAYEDWPQFNEEYLKADSITYPVQINGKVRADIEVDADKAKDKDYVLGLAKEEENVAKYLEEGNLVKEIFVPGRIVNLVVK
ncbi:MAG TPA: leucine--tRNA ligase, partial [Balneolaceae bacterium]|nr:leucine--tRNA ligase [Balneolaceae bacterium]